MDLDLGFGPRWQATGMLDFGPYRKPTSIWRPLSSTSHHPQAIHKTWPIQQVIRYASRSTNHHSLMEFLAGFLEEFEEHCPEHVALSSLQAFCKSPYSHRSRRARPERSSWLVMPFHAEMAKCGLSGSLRKVSNEQIGISWSLGGTHLGQLLKSLSRF